MTVDRVFEGYAALVEIAIPARIPPTILRDPADDEVLAVALSVSADFIVSGDNDLLDLQAFRRIPIVTPRDAVERALATAGKRIERE